MPIGPYLCLYQILTKYFKLHTQEFVFKIHSEKVTTTEVVSLACDIPTGHYQCLYQILSKYVLGYQSYGAKQDFGFKTDNYIIKKKVRVVSLARDTPTGPPLHLYQILSYYL